MSSIIKVNTVQDTDGNNIINENANTITIGASGDTISIPAGATLANNGTATGFASIAWQSSIVTAATLNADANKGYWIDTSSNACTVTLPGSASVGDQLYFVDYARNFGTNALTINQNSLNYQGNSSPNPIYNTNGQAIAIVYSGATKGWIPTTDDDVSFETSQTYSVNFLCIAGGGGGGHDQGGGGGAGGYRNSFNSEASGRGSSAETALSLTPGVVYTVAVGALGAGSTSGATSGADGGDSSISGTGITTITSIGGGGGAGNSSGNNGRSGGAGGGAAGTTGSAGPGTADQGFDGGIRFTDGSSTDTGGGGGAGQVGSTPRNSGGDGVASTITGSSVTRAGGGGGNDYFNSHDRSGGSGGGGSGGSTAPHNPATSATANTGSGGGAGSGNSPADGGDGAAGVVILRMATADYSGTTSGSPTVDQSTVSGQTILIFNASGSYTA